MTTPPVRRRRTAQQILLRRACQTKGLSKTQDVVEFSGKYRNGEKGAIVVLPTMARDLGLTQVKSPPRMVPKPRRLPAASICTVSGERKTAGKLSSGENLRDTLSSSRKLKPNECKRNLSGQRSGYTSRGSTKSQNSASVYPSKWPKNGSTEETKNVDSKASLEEITNCSPLNRTPYDHNLNTPLKSNDSSLCPPIKKKARRRNLKVPGVGGVPTQTKTQVGSRNHSSGDRTNHKRASSQSSGARVESRVYSGEEVCQVTCLSKSNSDNSNDSSKCKLNPGVTFKNYGGYSPSETEFDTAAETDTNRHCRGTDSFYKKIDKVSRPPHMYVNNAVWSLNMPSKTEVQEILDRVDGDDHRVNMTLSNRTSNKMRERRDGDRIRYFCNCSSKATRKGCATDEDIGCSCCRRSPDACISRNSVRFCGSDGSENDFRCHRSPREENYLKKRTCDDCGYSYKQSNGYESGHGTGRSRREPPSCHLRTRLPRPTYTMGAYWSPYATGNCERRRTSEAEYECMPGEAFANKKCTEAVTQTSKIIMTRRIDENSARASPNCSYNQVQGPLEENRCCRSKNKLSETELTAQLKKQDKFIAEQRSKLSALRIGKSQSLIIQPDQNKINLVRTKSVELDQLPSSRSPCQHESAPPPCKEDFSPLCPPCKQGSSNSYQKHNQFYEHLADQDTKKCPSVTASLCELSHEEAKLKRSNRNPRKRGRKASRSRNRSSSQKKDVNNCTDSPSYQRRTQSYENCYYKRTDQAEDQCDVIKILSILQKTVAGLEQEIKKGKGYESSRSSGNGCEPKWKKLCPRDEQNTPCPPCPQELSPACPPCEQELSPLNQTCAQELSPSSPCQPESTPLCPPCPQESSPCSPPCQQESSPCSPPCQQELPSLSPPCQQEMCPPNPPCQQETSPCSPPCQQDMHLASSPFKKKSAPLIPPRQKGLSRSPCQQRTSSPCHQGWSPSYHPYNYHYPACRFRFPQRNTGAVPLNYGRQVNPYYPNNHCKYVNQANMYQDRKALPLLYNWEQTNQRGLKISYRNVPDLGIERGYTRAELKYPTNLNERKTQPYPCTEPIYAAGFKTNKSINDPEGHRIFTNTEWYANNLRSNPCPLSTLVRAPMAEQRFPKYTVDPTQLGNQDLTNRGRVTFQKHVSSRSPCYQSECNSYDNLQYFEEMKTVLANMKHKPPCKDPQNADHFRKDVCCKDPYSLNYRLAPAECQGSPQAREINTKCAPPVPRHMKEPDFEDCETPNCSDRCRKHVKEIDSIILESPNYPDRYPRTRTVIESDISNFPEMFSRNRQENDSGICETSNISDRCPRNRKEIKTIICKNPNCPYRCPRNREEIDSVVCENPNSSYRFQRSRKDIDSEDCEDPNCPYAYQRNRKDINSEVCQSPNCPYRFQEKRMGVDSELCDNPNCPYELLRNREDIGSEVCDNPNCPYFQRNRKEIEICGSPNCPYRFPRNREDIVSEICDNPNCPYRFQGNRKDLNSELCESPNSRDRLKRAPNKTIICTNPQCPNKLKRGVIPYQELSDSLLRENPQTRCAETSSIESCEDPQCPAIKNNLWLSGGFESFESNSIVSQYITEYKTEDNRLKEGATCQEDYSRRQRVIFTDVTNNITRQDSGQSDRFDDESTQTKASSKNWYHRYVPFEKVPMHIAPGIHPQNRTRNRHNPYLMEDHQLNSYDKHILNNYERDKIEKCKPRESVKVPAAVRKPLSQIPTRDYNCCYPRRSSEYCSREDVRTKPCCCQDQLYEYDKCDSTSTSSDSCSSSGAGGSGCQCPEHRERLRAQREQPPVCCCRNNRRSTSKSSIFSCFKKKEKCCECYKPKQQKRERSTSKSSIFSCFRKKEKSPSQKRDSNCSCITSDKEERKPVRKTGSKLSNFFRCKKKEQQPSLRSEERERRRNLQKEENKSKSSGLPCFKKKEKPPPQESEYCDKRYCSRYAKKENDSQSEKTKSKSSGLPCFKKKENPPPQNENYERPKPKSNGPSCFKRKEKPPSAQNEYYGKRQRRSFETENDSQSEKSKSKSKSSGLPCFKRKEKPHSLQNENYGKKERRNFETENDTQSEKSKSKSSGLPCFRKREKPPPLQSENYDRKPECKNVEKDNEKEKNKPRSGGLPCFKKKEKPPSAQNEYYGKRQRRSFETENDTQSEKSKSKSSGIPCFKKKGKPEENGSKKERNDYPKQGEKKPCWLSNFQRTSRKQEKGDEMSERQEKTKKASNIPECPRCQTNLKTQTERSNEQCPCRQYQPTCSCAQQQQNNGEVKVLYDSSFRFNQDSCSCGDITESCCCCNPQELGAQERSACPRTAIRYGQCECANGFYKIGQ